MKRTEEEHNVSLSHKRPMISYCNKCQINETQFEDSENGLSFCSHQCQRLYHKYDIHSLQQSEWYRRRQSFFVRHLIGSTDIVSKYMLLIHLCEHYDVRSHIIMSLWFVPIMGIYLYPTLVSTHYDLDIFRPVTDYMLSGNGLLNIITKGVVTGRRIFHGLSLSSLSIKNQHTCIMLHRIRDNEIITPTFDENDEYSSNIQMAMDDKTMYGDMAIYHNIDTKGNELWSTNRQWVSPFHTNGKWGRINDIDNAYTTSHGNRHCVYIDTDGQLWYKGVTKNNQLLVGNEIIGDFMRLQIKQPCISVSCFRDTIMCITIDGSLWVCGDNKDFRTGLATMGPVREFTCVKYIPPIYHIQCHYNHSAAIDLDGNVWITGVVRFEQQPYGFTPIPYITGVVSVYCTNDYVYAITKDDIRWIFTCNGRAPGKIDLETGIPIFVSLDHLPILTPIEKNETKRQRIIQ